MKTINSLQTGLLAFILFFTLSCQKEAGIEQQPNNNVQQKKTEVKLECADKKTPPFNFDVILRGARHQFGLVKFRQNPDSAKIVTLDTWVKGLEPNHEYLLQRAVDTYDHNCTSTSWLTLGKGLTPQSIVTNAEGKGSENLWRDVSAVASGTTFDIHFRVVDATNMNVILDSECYAYTVR